MSNYSMHAKVLFVACRPIFRIRAGNTEKSGKFMGEFSWVEFDPVGTRGLQVQAPMTPNVNRLIPPGCWLPIFASF